MNNLFSPDRFAFHTYRLEEKRGGREEASGRGERVDEMRVGPLEIAPPSQLNNWILSGERTRGAERDVGEGRRALVIFRARSRSLA